MPRPPRIRFPGAWYHVFNRGARRQAVFLDDTDRRIFLDLVAEAAEEFGVEIHAYCLMGNHYHLLIRTPEPNLGDVMQYLIGRYTKLFNLRHGLDGALFRGRYHSVLVDSDRYLLTLSRYIHRNPIEGGLTADVAEYLWSSYPDYLGKRSKPFWLHTTLTLHLAGGVQAYAALVGAGFRDPELDEFYSRERIPPILGDPGPEGLAEAV